MGKGATTKQTGVTRHTPSYSSDVAAVGVGSGPAPEMANVCMIGFQEEIMLDGPSAQGAKAGLPITLIPGGVTGTVNVMSGAARLGNYTGDYRTLLLRCMRKKYVYTGHITSVRTLDDKIYATCALQGLGQV